MYRRPPLRASQVLLDAILDYSWPGNIRELENMMKRFVVLQDESLVLSELAHAKEMAAASHPAPTTRQSTSPDTRRRRNTGAILLPGPHRRVSAPAAGES